MPTAATRYAAKRDPASPPAGAEVHSWHDQALADRIPARDRWPAAASWAQTAAIAAFLAAALGAQPGQAQQREAVKPVFEHALPNVPGKSLIAVVVSYPPGGKSAAHRHAGSAFIYAHVLTGAIRSRLGDEPARVYRAGESFFEEPGAHHRVSENASNGEPASLLAVFVVDSQDKPLTVPDPDTARP